MHDYFDIRIDALDGVLGRCGFGTSNVWCAVDDLALEVGEIDGVKIDQADFADASGGRRQMAMGEPSPPAPMQTTLVEQIFFCPANPTSGKIKCREYRRISSLFNCIADCHH